MIAHRKYRNKIRKKWERKNIDGEEKRQKRNET
jgi:hypothetical protein